MGEGEGIAVPIATRLDFNVETFAAKKTIAFPTALEFPIALGFATQAATFLCYSHISVLTLVLPFRSAKLSPQCTFPGLKNAVGLQLFSGELKLIKYLLSGFH